MKIASWLTIFLSLTFAYDSNAFRSFSDTLGIESREMILRPPQLADTTRVENEATASFLSSIVSIPLIILGIAQFSPLFIFGGLLGILGLVLGIRALNKRKRIIKEYNPNARKPRLGKGLSIAGVVLGGVVSLFLLFIGIVIASYTGAF